MYRIFLFLMMFIFANSAFASIPVEILKIQDGDTVKAKIENGNKFFIRLQGIDCYETSKIHRAYKQAYIDKLSIDEVVEKGNSATKYLKKLNKNAREVSFDFMGIDRYGRALGILYFDKININQKLFEDGVCQIYNFKEL